jgi:hypothetical protein
LLKRTPDDEQPNRFCSPLYPRILFSETKEKYKKRHKTCTDIRFSYYLCKFMGEFNDIAQMLARLHELQGAAFSRQVERIALHAVFLPYKNDANILIAGGEQKSDFENLLNAARKAVSHGFRVFILPNPKGVRSADFILERKGLYKMYDLKTIQGKSSVINRLRESIGQTNRVLLNMSADYNARLLASDIKSYFEENSSANEVMIFKGNKLILVNRGLVRNTMFNRIFRKMYEK